MAFSALPRLSVIAMEKSTYRSTMTLTDPDGAALDPDSADWTLTKLDGTVVNSRDSVSISSPGSTIQVTLSGNDLAILDAGEREDRIFTIEGLYETSKPFKSACIFEIQQLVAVA